MISDNNIENISHNDNNIMIIINHRSFKYTYIVLVSL